MLLADTCEAAVRAIRPSSREDLKKLIDRLIDERINEGELDESNLTFKEVQQVKDVFIRVLEGVHHPRISYPEPVERRPATGDAAARRTAICPIRMASMMNCAQSRAASKRSWIEPSRSLSTAAKSFA